MTRALRSIAALLAALSALASGVAGAQEPGPQVDARQLRAALAQYAHEPSVERVVAAAVRASALDPEAVRSAASRARARGWLPTLRLGARHGQARDAYALQAAGSDRASFTNGDELGFEAWLSFDFGRVAFATEEVPLLREARSVDFARRELVRAIVHVYFERRRLQLERDLLGRDAIDHVMKIAEATALLDAFTAGEFGRMIAARFGRRARASP